MKRTWSALVVLAALALAASPAVGQATGPPASPTATYVVALLYKGPSWTPAVSAEAQKVRDAHAAHIQHLADQGVLLLAGRFDEGKELRGMLLLGVGTLEEARSLCEADPAIKSGRLRAELHRWHSAKDVRVSWEVPFPVDAAPSG